MYNGFVFKSGCSRGSINIQLSGGFGNQLFELANGLEQSILGLLPFRILAPIKGRTYALDKLHLQENLTYMPWISNGSLNFEVVESCFDCKFQTSKEESFGYKKLELESKHSSLVGYFQSFKYFELINSSYTSYLRELFVTNTQDLTEVKCHIRLGDFVSVPKFASMYEIPTEEYYQKAFDVFGKNQPRIIITDDVPQLNLRYPKLQETATKIVCSTDYHEDFSLLASSKQIITSNSTFSWWAAWISEGKVITPKNWFRAKYRDRFKTDDLIPPDWIVIN